MKSKFLIIKLRFNTKPQRIIVFKDDVNDLQKVNLKKFEIPAIKQCIGDAVLIFIGVSIKSSAKFYFGDNLMQNRLSNPKQGSCVSGGVCQKDEFYIIS